MDEKKKNREQELEEEIIILRMQIRKLKEENIQLHRRIDLLLEEGKDENISIPR